MSRIVQIVDKPFSEWVEKNFEENAKYLIENKSFWKWNEIKSKNMNIH